MASSSSSETDLSQLTSSQQEALQQYTSVTNQDLSAAIPLLRRSQWNVQIAIAKFFDGESAEDPVAEAQAALNVAGPSTSTAASSSGTAPIIHQRPTARSGRSSSITPAPRVTANGSTVVRRTPLILAILFLPFSLLYKLLGASFNFFTILFPFLRPLQRSFSQGPSPRRSTTTPRDTAARFIREFEEQTGVTNLPWFEGGYAQAMDLAKRDIRFFMVVLQSEEHDDTAVFNKETLGNADVVRWIRDQNVVLWGGSVSDSEGYQVSNALSTTAFPFVALVSLTPPSTSASSSSTTTAIPTTMSAIARISGLLPPQTLLSKLSAAVQTHSETLARIRAQRATHLADRQIREQQNSAYEISLARDRERVRLRREEEERVRKQAEEARMKQQEIEMQDRKREAWRKWRARKGLPMEPPSGQQSARVSIRFPDGERVIRRFERQTRMEEVYAWVECRDITVADDIPSSLPSSAAETYANPEEGKLLKGYNHAYRFKLVSPMPRKVFEVENGDVTVGEVLWPSGNLIVEEVGEDEDEDEEGV